MQKLDSINVLNHFFASFLFLFSFIFKPDSDFDTFSPLPPNQKILNKVEFFPIKCRIQNAKENFRKYQEDLKNAVKWDSDQFLAGNKTKVGHLFTWNVLLHMSWQICFICLKQLILRALQLILMRLQTIFFWTLIARNISRVLDKSGKLESVKGTNQTREQSESGGSPLEIDGNESQLSNEQDRQIEAAFSLFDTDENGFLADDEMKSALFALGYLTSSEGNISIRDLSQSYHIDSKKVDLDQFKKIMRGKIVRRSDLEEIQMTFCAIVNPTWLDQKLSTGTVVDVKELPSPKIDFEKLRQACNRYEVKLSDEELKNILKETDTNKDEDVDWDEYVSILKNSCWF